MPLTKLYCRLRDPVLDFQATRAPTSAPAKLVLRELSPCFRGIWEASWLFAPVQSTGHISCGPDNRYARAVHRREEYVHVSCQ